MPAPHHSFVHLDDDVSISTTTWGLGPPEIVFLHDGLGSVAQWRAVPAQVAEATRKTVLAYDRPGHGRSAPPPTGAWPADWLHSESDRLEQLLVHVEAASPLLVGHSDGGSIALIHGASIGSASRLLLVAAHSWVEQVCVDHIRQWRTEPDSIIDGLSKYHEHPAALFEAWSGVWTSPEFRDWDIRPLLGQISMPVHVVQGAADEYATEFHTMATAAAIGKEARYSLVPDRHHLMHHEDPDLVVRLVLDAL